MKIAVPYENGTIFQHFGHTARFKLYEAVEGNIVREEVVDTMGSGHGALAGFLAAHQVDTLMCGGIGAGARQALESAGIQLYGIQIGMDEGITSAIKNSERILDIKDLKTVLFKFARSLLSV